jgi:excisionase family DNA binding protein
MKTRLLNDEESARQISKLEPVQSDILDVADLAIMLRIHPVTVRLKAASGEIPGWQIGNRWRFYRSRIIERLSKGKDVSNNKDNNNDKDNCNAE